MKCLFTATLFFITPIVQAAVEPGFEYLLDGANAGLWRQCGQGGFNIKDGAGATWFPDKGYYGVAWFTQRTFYDFILRTEWRGVKREYNSGIRIRFPDPGGDAGRVSREGYEVSIMWDGYDGKQPNMLTGAIAHEQPPKTVPKLKAQGEWNELEVTAIGQKYTVRINGVLVNEFTGSKGLAGHIGVETHKTGPVEFRNLRIKDLSSSSEITRPTPLATIQTDANQPRIEVIKDRGPNATEWALTPLDEAIPADIRQNLTFLREDLLDEGKKAAKSSPEAYKLASEYCDKILAALDQRDLTRVSAGYATAQADASKHFSNQTLDARRNHQMSWPQYAREESQRAALRENETDKVNVKKQRLKVEWTSRAVQMRTYLDDLYRQLREAMRE
jgi:hypothetical protein